jgi:hypothetical protein
MKLVPVQARPPPDELELLEELELLDELELPAPLLEDEEADPPWPAELPPELPEPPPPPHAARKQRNTAIKPNLYDMTTPWRVDRATINVRLLSKLPIDRINRLENCMF